MDPDGDLRTHNYLPQDDQDSACHLGWIGPRVLTYKAANLGHSVLQPPRVSNTSGRKVTLTDLHAYSINFLNKPVWLGIAIICS